MTAGGGFPKKPASEGNASDRLTWGRSSERAGSKERCRCPKTPERSERVG
jgi:hypothetical protein